MAGWPWHTRRVTPGRYGLGVYWHDVCMPVNAPVERPATLWRRVTDESDELELARKAFSAKLVNLSPIEKKTS